MAANGQKLIESVTLGGLIYYSATDPFERVRVSARCEDSARRSMQRSFTFSASDRACCCGDIFVEWAPELKDGHDRTPGSRQRSCGAGLPAAGGDDQRRASGVAPAIGNVAGARFVYWPAANSLTPSTPAAPRRSTHA